ncbi:MAG: 4Fe-4S binding protein [Candidatus Bathyarchaeota archaeon]|nr:4Fe-4S binding protein [Candidatus Termiticorpusculum sp.]
MIRKIIKINNEKCTGCSLCISACHEGALAIVNGKAKLVRDDYCDGLGNCLPVCPTGAITFEEREATEYNKTAVKNNQKNNPPPPTDCNCPSTQAHAIKHENPTETINPNQTPTPSTETHLNQWPIQIKLVPPNASYFNNANLLVAADCTAYAYGNFHNAYMKNKITLIGCPKLDEEDYSKKLTTILKTNDIKTVTVTQIEVPCCNGIKNAVKTALQNCGKTIPCQIIVISTDGKILKN